MERAGLWNIRKANVGLNHKISNQRENGMGETTRGQGMGGTVDPRSETPSVQSTPKAPVPRSEAPKALSEGAKKLLEELMRFYAPQGYPYNYEKMDPDRGGVFKDELVQLTGESSEGALEELLDASLVSLRETPKMSTSTTVWLTGKGMREGEKERVVAKEEKSRTSGIKTP